ncbi:PREDICTED: salutaridinol 7-O-acetyltransferase-like [Ipomoea nil]|uniref:salutaridinol 7-O-acetyltransferase-like n=1 Tax=Ipomoea nil TaxID=35883 RepID=UPI0009014ACD|nr:PREDICTED: salutaridinol 7-O-acetyltransferase-like [Ipomoea nil]
MTIMKVETVSRQLIKPSSSSSSRLHKLCLLDQIAPHGYNPILLFYPTALSESDFQQLVYDNLRVSLSKTLAYMQPLAGRLKDDFTIECNDDGVDFVVVKVFEEMSSVLRHPKTDLLRQLLPVNPETVSSSTRALLMVQVNRFACGGLAVGLCTSHAVTDAVSMTAFLKTWARINRRGGENDDDDDEVVAKGFVVLDCTPFFPPRDVNGFSLIPLNTPAAASSVSTRRLIFAASKIAALRESADQGCRRPSRVEAVSALIWEAVIAAFRETNPAMKTHIMLSAIDLRSKMQPPLPQESIGNIFHVTEAKWEATADAVAIHYNSLVGKVQESMQRAKNTTFTPMHFGDEFLKAVKSGIEMMRNSEDIGFLMTSSICRFPVYEIEFGFGKPEWVGNGIRAMNVCILSDTKNGNDIEAFLGLSEEHMHILEHNPTFLSHVSFIQSL